MDLINARPAEGSAQFRQAVIALVVCQFGLHACVNGMRVAVPLQALHLGHSVFTVGLLVALFALIPALFAIRFGQLTDRRGYHWPVRFASVLSIAAGCTLFLSDSLLALCAGAALSGTGSGFGMIAIQRYASRLSSSSLGRVKVFSWIGLAPAVAGLLSATLTGVLIDQTGFRVAFAALALFPFITLLVTSWVPAEHDQQQSSSAKSTRAGVLDLLKLPMLRRVLLINWVLAVAWDAHTFVIPIIGHEQGLSATAIGGIFASFSLAAILIRVLIPLLPAGVSMRAMLTIPMLLAAAAFFTYPYLNAAWALCLCAFAFGLALGCVFPTLLSAMHDMTPPGRHGEALAIRSTLTQLSLTAMPVVFGAVGLAIGSSVLLWTLAAALCMGAFQTLSLNTELPLAATDTKT